MKNTGALRYIQDKEVLNAILRYEEKADLVESRSMGTETDQYNNEFRPAIAKIFPLSFFKYISDDELKSVTKKDSMLHPGRYENYKFFSTEINKELDNTKFTKDEMKMLGKAWHFRQERAWVSLRFQIELKEEGETLLKLVETKYHN